MDNVVLLADRNSPSWSFAEKIQSYIQKERETSVSLYEISMQKFRNGEINMYVPENIRGKEIYFIHDSTKDPQEWWVQLILLKDLLLSASAESVSFVLPNMLYSTPLSSHLTYPRSLKYSTYQNTSPDLFSLSIASSTLSSSMPFIFASFKTYP